MARGLVAALLLSSVLLFTVKAVQVPQSQVIKDGLAASDAVPSPPTWPSTFEVFCQCGHSLAYKHAWSLILLRWSY